MSHHRIANTGDPVRDWADEGPRPSAGGTGVGWSLGTDSGQIGTIVNLDEDDYARRKDDENEVPADG